MSQYNLPEPIAYRRSRPPHSPTYVSTVPWPDHAAEGYEPVYSRESVVAAIEAALAAAPATQPVPSISKGSDRIAACDPDTIRALLAERDALREALAEVLRVNETDAGSDVKAWANAMLNAHAALEQEQEQEQGGSDAE